MDGFKPGDEVEATIRGKVQRSGYGDLLHLSPDDGTNKGGWWPLPAASNVQRISKPRKVGSWWKDSSQEPAQIAQWRPDLSADYPWALFGYDDLQQATDASMKHPIYEVRVVFTPTGDVEEGPR